VGEERYVTVSEARKVLGVSYITLWRWIREGRIRAVRGPSGRWLIPVTELERLRGKVNLGEKTRVAIYARVSSRKQAEQEDLDRQVEALKKYAAEQGYEIVAVIRDVGSGLKEDRPGLKRLFRLVTERRIDAVLVTNHDRLTRFGYGYLKYFFEKFGVDVIEVMQDEKEPLEELVEDFLSIVVSFAGRIDGMRSHKAKKLIETNKRLLEEVLGKSLDEYLEKAYKQ
jgi:putative resolvase